MLKVYEKTIDRENNQAMHDVIKKNSDELNKGIDCYSNFCCGAQIT